jgi:hypothetical protein
MGWLIVEYGEAPCLIDEYRLLWVTIFVTFSLGGARQVFVNLCICVAMG